jgi:hypothetical protein
LATVEKSVFTSSHCTFAIQIVNSIISTTTVYLVLQNLSRICELLLRAQGIHAPLGKNITWPSTRSLFMPNSYSISDSSWHTRCSFWWRKSWSSAFQETFENVYLHLPDQIFMDLLSIILICNQTLRNSSCLCMKKLSPLSPLHNASKISLWTQFYLSSFGE